MQEQGAEMPTPKQRRQTKADVRHLEANMLLFLNLLGCFKNFLVAGRTCAAQRINARSVQESGGESSIFQAFFQGAYKQLPAVVTELPLTLEDFCCILHQVWTDMLGFHFQTKRKKAPCGK